MAVTSKPLKGDTYKEGENIEVEYTFSANVTYAGGIAAIRVGDDGDNNYRSAGYVGGSGTTKLLYRYKVKSTDTDATGISVDNDSLGASDRGNILDGAGNAVTLTHSQVAQDAEHKVDGSTRGCEYVLCTDVTVANLTDADPPTVLGAIYYAAGPTGSLSNRSFYLGGNYVVVEILERNGTQLEILLDRPPGQKLLDAGTLHFVGTEGEFLYYHFHEGAVSGNRVTWNIDSTKFTVGAESGVTIEDDVLVSNLGQASSNANLSGAITKFAQRVEIGDNPNGFLIDEIRLKASAAAGVTLSVSLQNFLAEGFVTMASLTAPSSLGTDTDVDSFTLSEPLFIRRQGSFYIVVERSGSGTAGLSFTTSDAEDRGNAYKWKIKNDARSFENGAWSTLSLGSEEPSMQVAVLGEEARNLPATGRVDVTGFFEQGQTVATDPFKLQSDAVNIDLDGIGTTITDPQRVGTVEKSTQQWIRVDGNTETNIPEATKQTYTIQAADVGKRLKVKVSFKDFAGNSESITSDATEVIAAAPSYLISNLGQSSDITSQSDRELALDSSVAQDFSTGADAYRLQAVRIHSAAGPRYDLPVYIYSDVTSAPGSLLHTLAQPALVDTFGETQEEYTGTGIVLSANTTYWVVVGAKDRPPYTSDFGDIPGLLLVLIGDDKGDEDAGGATGWSIGNELYTSKEDDDGAISWFEESEVLMMGLRGVIVPPTPTAPAFANDAETLTVAENAASGAVVGTITATDADADTLTYSVTGTDIAAFNQVFSLDTGAGAITVKTGASPNFEGKAVYTITLRVTDGEDAMGNAQARPIIDDTVAVTINVTDVEEEGTISLSPATPAVGFRITATVNDPDGSVTGAAWQWQKSTTETGTYGDISGATRATYTPVNADLAQWLKVKATYTDRRSSGKTAESAPKQVDDNPFKTPEFANETEALSVNENVASGTVVGTITATDEDGDTLTYSVTGTDITAFNQVFILNTATGRITVRSGASPNFEDKKSFSITLGVTDGEDAMGNAQVSPSIDDWVAVAITVTDVEEEGTVTLSPSSPALGRAVRSTLTDPDGPDGEITPTSLTWSRGDSAGGSFTTITGATESTYTPVKADIGKFLKVQVGYSDRRGSGKSASATTRSAVTEITGPPITVKLGAASYSVNEGGRVSIPIILSRSAFSARATISVPILITRQGGADSADFWVPTEVHFSSGSTITRMDLWFTAEDDLIDDDGESVKLKIGTLQSGVNAGTPNEATVTIIDDDLPIDASRFVANDLAAHWTGANATGDNIIWLDSCRGTHSFRLIWNGPQQGDQPNSWNAHVTGSATVRYTARQTAGGEDYYWEMTGTARMTGPGSFSIRVQGVWGPDREPPRGGWSPPVSLYCREN